MFLLSSDKCIDENYLRCFFEWSRCWAPPHLKLNVIICNETRYLNHDKTDHPVNWPHFLHFIKVIPTPFPWHLHHCMDKINMSVKSLNKISKSIRNHSENITGGGGVWECMEAFQFKLVKSGKLSSEDLQNLSTSYINLHTIFYFFIKHPNMCCMVLFHFFLNTSIWQNLLPRIRRVAKSGCLPAPPPR